MIAPEPLVSVVSFLLLSWLEQGWTRTLLIALEKSGFPPPQKLLAWGRLIVAAQMLEDPNKAADAVARQLDFPSGSAFRNTCQRYLGPTPHEIRGKGGAVWAANRFLQEIGHLKKR